MNWIHNKKRKHESTEELGGFPLFLTPEDHPTFPPSRVVPNIVSDMQWDKKGWISFLKESLEYLSREENEMFPLEKVPIFHDSLLDGEVFCFFFRGMFLPSGNKDGFFWKPSKGVQLQGGELIRRYFYCKSKGRKIQRQVTWLKDRPDLVCVEYKTKSSSILPMMAIHSPKGFSWLWTFLIKNSKECETCFPGDDFSLDESDPFNIPL
eukprot:TRINITY_DN799_c0_g2_i1.p1 TRINITY_DN799_c0_g2~~TRINITY_DN799_c0_g2_i1.p1  ORF type:complete len:208 (-),score=60.47 TRINITY_DN799_c0_g2_i1:183-806(-)